MKEHSHAGKSSENILDVDMIIDELELNENDVFLDVGCGDGYFSIKVSHIVQKVFAIDPHEYSINQLKKKKVSNIEPMVSSIVSTGLIDDLIDVIYISNVLHGLVVNHEFDNSMNEINRILKKDGKLAIVEFNKIEADRGPRLENKLSPEQVEELIVPFGFKKEKVVGVGELSYLMKFKKISF